MTDARWCWNHSPAVVEQRARARQRGGQNRRTPRGGPVPDCVVLRSVGDVQRLLELAVRDTLVMENSSRRAGALASLLGLALRAVEVGSLEERLQAIEARLAAVGSVAGRRDTLMLGGRL